MTKKILVLGAGIGQIPIITKAKKLGYTVIVVSINGNYPGFKFADKIYYEDVKNKENILEIAINEKVDAVLSDQNDIPVETLGFLTEKLNLTGNSHAVATLFSHKNLMRNKCLEIEVPTIEYFIATTLNEALVAAEKIGYPIVCKPIDNQSSKGVFKVINAEVLKHVFDKSISFSFSSCIILEKFIEGTEFVIEGMAIKSKFKNLLLLERIYFELDDLFIPSMVTAPAGLTEKKKQELLDLNNTVCTSFGLQNGFSHAEYILNQKDKKFYLVEAAARGGGVYTSSHLMSYACGFDTSDFLINLALGKNMNIEDFKYADKSVRYICFYLRPGVITEIIGVDLVKKMSNVIEFFDEKISLIVDYKGMKDKSDRLGPILLGANTIDEILIATEKIKETFYVLDEKGQNMIVWD